VGHRRVHLHLYRLGVEWVVPWWEGKYPKIDRFFNGASWYECQFGLVWLERDLTRIIGINKTRIIEHIIFTLEMAELLPPERPSSETMNSCRARNKAVGGTSK
jgi:hypothetical protein